MKRLLILLLLAGLLCGCSARGAHMPKHRKKHHCNCPTFSMSPAEELPTTDV